MQKFYPIILLFVWFTACTDSSKLRQQYIAEIKDVEGAFMQMARDSGIGEAFVYYADSQAVINRGRQIIKGVDSIQWFYQQQDMSGIKLEWEPMYIDVSASGDLAYTYGYFKYSANDSSETPVATSGVFHTVWKRQADDTWKYVWD